MRVTVQCDKQWESAHRVSDLDKVVQTSCPRIGRVLENSGGRAGRTG